MPRSESAPIPSGDVQDQAIAVNSKAQTFADYVGGNLRADGVLDLYLTNPSEVELQQIRAAGDVRVSVIAVPRSLAELNSIRDRITADMPALTARGIHITFWGPDPLDDKVDISVWKLTTAGANELYARYGTTAIKIMRATAPTGVFPD